jgi:aspartate aminotransferase
MEHLSKRIKNMAPSATVAMNQKSQEMKSEGIDIINMSVGEPDFPSPLHVKEAAKEAIKKNITYYSPVPGFVELRKAISQKMKKENHLDYTVSEIVVSNGAKHALANAIMCLIDEGDEVIVPAPYWVTYVEQVKIAGGKNVVINASMANNFKITAGQIENAITSKTKAVILCSPSNPTGAVYTKNELKAIANVIAKYDNIYVIADEIYEYLNFVGPHESIAQFDNIKNRAVIINGVSKGFAMTGYRIGYMCAPGWLAEACTKLQGQLTTGASSVSQMAAIAALKGNREYCHQMKLAYQRRRSLVTKLLDQLMGIKYCIPDGAFYVFPDISSYYGKSDGDKKINNSKDMSMYLLEKAHVGTVPGKAFGDPNCIRISYATSDKLIEKGINQIKLALSHLK